MFLGAKRGRCSPYSSAVFRLAFLLPSPNEHIRWPGPSWERHRGTSRSFTIAVSLDTQHVLPSLPLCNTTFTITPRGFHIHPILSEPLGFLNPSSPTFSPPHLRHLPSWRPPKPWHQTSNCTTLWSLSSKCCLLTSPSFPLIDTGASTLIISPPGIPHS